MNRDFLHGFLVEEGVTFTDTGTTPHVTYNSHEINHLADVAAHGLDQLGLAPNSKIAILGNCSIKYITLLLGIYRSRHCAVSINFKMPQAQINYCLEHAEAAVVFCDPEYRHLVPAHYQVIDIACTFPEVDSYVTRPMVDDDYIQLIFTSGTTGHPKAAAITYQNRIWNCANDEIKSKIRAESCIVVAPFFHLAGINNLEISIFYTPYTTCHLVIMPKFDAAKYIQLIKQYKISTLRLVAPMMGMILQETSSLVSYALQSVTSIILTSSAMSETMHAQIKKTFPRVRTLINPYGLTETSRVFTYIHPDGIPLPKMSVGCVGPGVAVRIVDGVLQVKSKGLLDTYYKSPELYHNKMTDDGYFITGDLFRVNKYGFYFFEGRADDMFKSGGEKIIPREVETALELHPDVAMAAIVGMPDEIKGHKPYAFVRLHHGKTASGYDIQQFVVGHVAPYEIPREVWILDQLPLTYVGKIDYKLLKTMAEKLIEESK